MYGYDKQHRNEYLQVSPKVVLVVNEEMQQEMERLHKQGRRKRLLTLVLYAFILLVLAGCAVGLLIILCLKLG